MYQSKNAHFNNCVDGNIIVSEYSGIFDFDSLIAIFEDVIGLAAVSDLKHWAWYQKPAPDTDITDVAIGEMIRRYQNLHVHGCCAIGVIFSNARINTIELPHDGSIKFPFKVSPKEESLFQFFTQATTEAGHSEIGAIQQSVTAKARQYDILSSFLTSTRFAKLDSDFFKTFTGFTKSQLDANPVLPTATLVKMQAFVALCSVVAFSSAVDQPLSEWLNVTISELGASPVEMVSHDNGFYDLFQYLSR